MRALTTDQMRALDAMAITELGLPSIVLMENAGRLVADAVRRFFGEIAEERGVAVVSGTGNNGGDGFVAARHLAAFGLDVSVYLVGDSASVSGDATTNLAILERLGVPVLPIADPAAWSRHRQAVLDAGVAIDALFGTGLGRPLDGIHAEIAQALADGDAEVVAVDLPSGVPGDPGAFVGPAVDATLTVTLAAPKLSLVLPPAEQQAGVVLVADIGIPRELQSCLEGPQIDLLDAGDLALWLDPRPADAHKGDFGRVTVVGGSPGKTGAAHLAALSALRSGAGLVTVAVPAPSQPVVAAMAAEYMTLALPELTGGDRSAAVEAVLSLDADVIAVGPGLGVSDGAAALVEDLVARSTRPLVLDADALNVLTRLPAATLSRANAPVVLTPHPGEMARLAGTEVDDVQSRRLEIARDYAAAHGVVVVLKGYRTVIASPDGRVAINATGNPGMATGGTGDVLTGVIAAWLAQIGSAEAAARLGVYLHGLAGDLAAAAEGEVAMIAGDLLDHLGQAARTLAGLEPRPEEDWRARLPENGELVPLS